MQFDITVSLQQYHERRIDFTLVWTPDQGGAQRFELAALNHPLVRVDDLTVEIGGTSIPVQIDEQRFTFNAAAPAAIRYSVVTPFIDCMGSDRHVDLIYPFINAQEVFLGTGALAYPLDLPRLAPKLRATFQLIDLPAGWEAFSSMITGGAHPAKLDGFFCYCAPRREPEMSIFEGKEKRVTFRWLTQHGKPFADLPLLIESAHRWLAWLEANLAPYSGLENIDVLLLRAAPDYRAQTQGRAFASGENVLNGIAGYASDDPDSVSAWGYPSYRAFLVSGILHEIMHFYTSAAWSAAYKSILYPAPDCPRADRQLIGELLNLYFSERFAGMFDLHSDRFAALERLDRGLQGYGTSLQMLFAAMLERKRVEHTPYPSADWMFDVLRDDLGIDAPELRHS